MGVMNSKVVFRLGSLFLSFVAMALSSHAEVIYVSSFSGGSILRIQPDGSQTTIARDLNYPTGIALDSAGRVYVASSTTNRIVMIDSNGSLFTVGRAIYPAGYTAMAFDPLGRFILANQDVNGLFLMTTSGNSLPRGGGLASPFGLAFDRDGTLHVAHMNKTGSRGLISQSFPDGTSRVAVTNLHSPAGMAFDGEGRLYVAEKFLGLILRIDRDGNRTEFATGLSGPYGLAFSGDGQLLVAEFFAGRITAISMSGERVVRASGLVEPMYLAVAEASPAAIRLSIDETSPTTATLLLTGSPLSYHEVYVSSDLSAWRSLGTHQLLGGNRLTLGIPTEEGATQGFYATMPR